MHGRAALKVQCSWNLTATSSFVLLSFFFFPFRNRPRPHPFDPSNNGDRPAPGARPPAINSSRSIERVPLPRISPHLLSSVSPKSIPVVATVYPGQGYLCVGKSPLKRPVWSFVNGGELTSAEPRHLSQPLSTAAPYLGRVPANAIDHRYPFGLAFFEFLKRSEGERSVLSRLPVRRYPATKVYTYTSASNLRL